MSAENKIVITLVGRTGDGKSTLGNELLKCLGIDSRPFAEIASAEAGTRVSACYCSGDIIVVDNPGLLDPDGQVQDSQNITTIITKARELGHINILVLVMNSTAPRFDDGMQNALKLISDSFGRNSLNHLFVVYTNCLLRDDEILTRRTGQILSMINRRCQTELKHLTYFAVENHPEKFKALFSADHVGRLRSEARAQLEDLLRAARAQEQFSTANSKAGEYDHVRILKKEKQEHAESQAHAVEEARLRRDVEMREVAAEKERARERVTEKRREAERQQERAEEQRRAKEMEKARADDLRRHEEAERRRDSERQEERLNSKKAEQQREKERAEDMRRLEALADKQKKGNGILGVLLPILGGIVGGPPGVLLGGKLAEDI